MNTTTNRVPVGEASRRDRSLLSTPKTFAQGPDYDPQFHMYTVVTELVTAVSQLEARLAVLEQCAGSKPATVVTETQERG